MLSPIGKQLLSMLSLSQSIGNCQTDIAFLKNYILFFRQFLASPGVKEG
jgi:hypothetical protein